MPRNSVFLSGWEYNRLLEKDPTAWKQSCLPSEPLWNGGAQFWLFERVYCTKESFECERDAGDATKMATARIYEDLAREGILVPFDLTSLPPGSAARRDLVATHQALKERYSERILRGMIVGANTAALETIKLQLLRPVMSYLHCAQNVSPNSITNWFRRRKDGPPSSLPAAHALEAVGKAAERKISALRIGTSLCRPPGTGVPRRMVDNQKRIEKDVQTDMIPDLFLGRLSMKDYLEAQVPFIGDFEPISRQLLNDWSRNKDKLLRLRDLAQQHVWSDLHNDWLPRLEEDPTFRPEFNGIVADAIARARLGAFLDWTTQFVVLGFAIAVGKVVTTAFGAEWGVPAGVAAKDRAKKLIDDKLKASENLALFFQRVKRLSKNAPAPQ